MMETDIIVLGAGPAGMAAATQAAQFGLKVVLIDEQAEAGGQIYRAVGRSSARQLDILGSEFTYGWTLVSALAEAGVSHVPNAVVWQLDRDGTVTYSVNGQVQQVSARRIVLALGALERPMPVPGWTLPGVMTAGAAQILMKQSCTVPSEAVIAGSGPLLYLLAQQLLRAGHPPKAMVETQSLSDLVGALRHLPGALRRWRYLAKGVRMLVEIRKAGVERFTGARDVRVEGDRSAEAIAFSIGGATHRVESATILLHQGVVPNVQASRALGLDHRWSERQRTFVPIADEWGRTSNGAFYVAGDCAGIGGAKAAEHAGRIAAMDAAKSLGVIDRSERDMQSRPERRALAAETLIRPFLDVAYPPAQETLCPADETIVCRCEEVTAGDIRRYAKLGCAGPNQAKAFGRSGMGPCQGRYCGLTVTEVLAKANGRTPEETGYFRIRSPLRPLTVGELATLSGDDAGPETMELAR